MGNKYNEIANNRIKELTESPKIIEEVKQKSNKKNKELNILNDLDKIFEVKKQKNKSTSLYLSDIVMEALDVIKNKTGKSKSEIANEILEAALRAKNIIE